MVFGFGSTPAPVVNGLTQNQANAAMVKALHNVANVKLRNALKAAKNAANAAKNGTIAERNKTIAELQAAINAARPVVAAAANVAPNRPVEPATQTAEAAATNAVIKTAVANNGSETNVKWNGNKWVKINNSTAPGFYVNWNKNKGKNNIPRLVQTQALNIVSVANNLR